MNTRLGNQYGQWLVKQPIVEHYIHLARLQTTALSVKETMTVDNLEFGRLVVYARLQLLYRGANEAHYDGLEKYVDIQPYSEQEVTHFLDQHTTRIRQ